MLKIIILLCIALVFISTSPIFAASERQMMKPTKRMSNETLIKMVAKEDNISGSDVNVLRLSESQKSRVLETTSNIDLKKSEVYVIERKISNNKMETSVVSDIAIPASTGGQASETKEGRISITCVLGYERMNFNNISYVKGTYYGGRVSKQESLSQVKSLKGTYVDCGAYVTKSGATGISNEFKDSKTFDITKHTTLQTKSINRDKYFNTNMTGVSVVSAKYTATYTTGNNKDTVYTISVNANAYS